MEPRPTRGDGWGSREESQRELDGIKWTCIAYFDDQGRCYYKTFVLLDAPQDAPAKVIVEEFVDDMEAAAPGGLWRAR